MKDRCIKLRSEKHIDISIPALFYFYKKNGIKNYKSTTTYGPGCSPQRTELRDRFALKLAQMVSSGQTVVYMDESSFNAWLRRTKTWFHAKQPVKLVVNSFRGQGITVFGAIGEQMVRPVFMTATGTNQDAVLSFLPRIRSACPHLQSSSFLQLVVDNHTSHHTKAVARECQRLKINLHFQPAYSPEFNSIETLWSLAKARIKRALNA